MISRRKFAAGGVATSYLTWSGLRSQAKLLDVDTSSPTVKGGADGFLIEIAGNIAVLVERSLSYRNLYDRATGFMRPKLAKGDWAVSLANNEMGYSPQWRDYTESNPWQATFAVQHDPSGLAELMGRRKKLAEKLDGIFSVSSVLLPDAPSDIAGLVGTVCPWQRA